MIKSFADKETENLFSDGRSRRIPSELIPRALRKLDMLGAAYRLEDLRVPPGNKLHALRGDRTGFHAIAINGQWRIYFRFEGEDAFGVEVCDYH